MSKAARQRTARERLAEERRRQADRQKKVRTLMVSLGALVLIGAVVTGIGLYQANKDSGGAADNVALPPASRQADGSIVVAKAGVTAPVLEVFEDFQCPICKRLEEDNGKTIKQLAAEGKVKLIYRPFWLFRQSQEPTRSNSERALNASFCAPADKWVAYHDKLYSEQGAETSSGFANKDLISWAGDVGITGDAFAKCVNGKEKSAAITQADGAAQQAGIDSTPTLVLNGQKITDEDAIFTAAGLRKAVAAAAKTAPPASPSAAPSSPSASPSDE